MSDEEFWEMMGEADVFDLWCMIRKLQKKGVNIERLLMKFHERAVLHRLALP